MIGRIRLKDYITGCLLLYIYTFQGIYIYLFIYFCFQQKKVKTFQKKNYILAHIGSLVPYFIAKYLFI